MASERTKAYIKGMTDGWDGEDPVPVVRRRPGTGNPRQVNAADLQAWLDECYAFQRKVRRDILVLENLLVAKGVINEQDLYGDPGDPPPDPEI